MTASRASRSTSGRSSIPPKTSGARTKTFLAHCAGRRDCRKGRITGLSYSRFQTETGEALDDTQDGTGSHRGLALVALAALALWLWATVPLALGQRTLYF